MMNTETRHRQKLPVAAFDNASETAVRNGEKQVTVREAAAIFAARFEYLRNDLGWTWRAITEYFTEHTSHPIGNQTLRNYHSALLRPTESNPSNEVLAARAQVAREVAEIRERQSMVAPSARTNQPAQVLAAARPSPSVQPSERRLSNWPAIPAESTTPAVQHPGLAETNESAEWAALVEAMKKNAASGMPSSKIIYQKPDGTERRRMISPTIQERVLSGAITSLEKLEAQIQKAL